MAAFMLVLELFTRQICIPLWKYTSEAHLVVIPPQLRIQAQLSMMYQRRAQGRLYRGHGQSDARGMSWVNLRRRK